MSASILNDEPIQQSEQPLSKVDHVTCNERPMSALSDLVDLYAVAEYLPPADWVTRLNLVRPRRDVLCLSTTTRFFKRTLDIVVSLAMLLVLAPLLLLTALAVRLTSPGPVIFRQQRVGLNLRGSQEEPKDRRQTADRLVPESADRRQVSNHENRRRKARCSVRHKRRPSCHIDRTISEKNSSGRVAAAMECAEGRNDARWASPRATGVYGKTLRRNS